MWCLPLTHTLMKAISALKSSRALDDTHLLGGRFYELKLAWISAPFFNKCQVRAKYDKTNVIDVIAQIKETYGSS